VEVLGLNNKVYKWNPVNTARDFSSCSSYHVRARKVIKEVYPFDIILEEVDLPGTNVNSSSQLRADFFIPKRKLMFEVHGEQHYEYNSLFHSSDADLKKGQAKDKNKRRWCELNKITYIELPYNEDDEQWQKRMP